MVVNFVYINLLMFFFLGEIDKVYPGRIMLCTITAEYLTTGLNLLGINTLSKM